MNIALGSVNQSQLPKQLLLNSKNPPKGVTCTAAAAVLHCCYTVLWGGVEGTWKLLCTGGVSYEFFISLLISILFCTKGEEKGGREIHPSLPLPPRDEVNSLCPGGVGRGWLAGQSELTLSRWGRKGEGREGEGHWKGWALQIT